MRIPTAAKAAFIIHHETGRTFKMGILAIGMTTLLGIAFLDPRAH